jgi:hypothetical protein
MQREVGVRSPNGRLLPLQALATELPLVDLLPSVVLGLAELHVVPAVIREQ